MMHCPRCQRANPDEAAFCYFDGFALHTSTGASASDGADRLPHAFVFPSGRRCPTYDELVLACRADWPVARDLLQKDAFRQFMLSTGRMDLVQAAEEAVGQPDADVALESFLASLPVAELGKPSLDLTPRRINLETVYVGDSRTPTLRIRNQGEGLLHGTITVSPGQSWLRFVGNKNPTEARIKAMPDQELALRIETKGLAAPHTYSAKLTVLTNGGITEVPVRLNLSVQPFPKAPFQGVSTPREMAEKMRLQPRAAGPLLEAGDVANWFSINGWTYPVVGPSAKGVAAVQQFFEGMGLSKPPTVQVLERELQLTAVATTATLPVQLTVRAETKKWVYARIESNAAWLRVQTPLVSGPQQAIIALEAHTENLAHERTHQAIVTIYANAGQTLKTPVQLRFVREEAPQVQTKRASPLLVGAIAGLLLRLILALPQDFYARLLMGPRGDYLPGTLAAWLHSPLDEPFFVRHFVLATWWVTGLIGAFLLWRHGTRQTDVVAGFFAGAATGVVASATLACVSPLLDLFPRSLLRAMAGDSGWASGSGLAPLWTAVWIVLASGHAMLWGALIGAFLQIAGDRGGRWLDRLRLALAWGFRSCGWRQAAAYFAA